MTGTSGQMTSPGQMTSSAYSTSTPPPNGSIQVTFIISVLIATVGTVTNILSLSYFVITIRSSTSVRRRNSISPTTKIFIALNVFDLILSISAVSFFASLQPIIYDNFSSLLDISYIVFTISVFATSFLTCLMSIVRAISAIFPHHVINWVLVRVFMVLYSAVVLVLILMRALFPIDSISLNMIFYHVRFLILVSLFVIVLLSNTLMIRTVHQSHIEKKKTAISRKTFSLGKKKATVTVGILSAIYCACNIGMIVIAGIPLFQMATYNNIPIEIVDTFIYILVPLNSACNPVVFLTRRSAMRSYLKEVSGRLTGNGSRLTAMRGTGYSLSQAG